MPAIPVHNTEVIDREWDATSAMAEAPNSRAVLRHMCAWVDPDGDPTVKSSYKFPHHGPRAGAPAVISAVRNGLARLSQADIPERDRTGVERHLRAHLEEFQGQQDGDAED